MTTGAGPRRLNAFRVGVAVILLAVLAVRLWSVGRWSWMLDDWIYMEHTRSMSFVGYLFQNYNGHLMPGEFLVEWVLTRVAPLAHGPVVILTAVAATGVGAVWSLALRELCGERLLTLVPLALVTLTPLLVQGTIWWASALQTLPLMAALGGCTYFATRVARHGCRADRLGLVLVYLGGLLMWEKALLLAIPVLAVLLYLRPPAEPVAAQVRGALKDAAGVVGVAVAYAAVYAVLARRPSSAPTPVSFHARDPVVVLGSFRDLLSHLVAPGLLGGPWGSLPTEQHVHSHPGWLVQVLAATALVGGLVLASLTRRSVWLPVAMVVLFSALSWGSLALSSRLEFMQFTQVSYERYAVDTFAVSCLAVALLLSPEAARRPGTGAAWARRWAALLSHPSVAGALVVALIASLGISNVTAVRRIGVSPARAWVRNVTADVHRLAPVTIDDDIAPNDVLFAPFWGDRALLSRMLAPLGDRVRFDRPADPMHVVTKDGRIVPAVVEEAVRSRPGPVQDCGYAVGPGADVSVPMTRTLYPYRWGVQVNAFTGHGARILLEVGGKTIPLSMHRGLNAPQAVFIGPVTDVRLVSRSHTAVVCVTDVRIGGVSAQPPG